MARKINWYFEGWKKDREITDSGREKTVWKYSGVYYEFQLNGKNLTGKQLTMMKAGYTCLSVLLIGLWILFSFLPGAGRENAPYVGAPWFLQIIPFMYLIMGLYGIWRSGTGSDGTEVTGTEYDGTKMTYRDVYAGYYRIRIVKWILLILQLISVIGEIIFLIIYHSYISVGAELLWILGAILCLLMIIGIFILHRRICPYQIPEE